MARAFGCRFKPLIDFAKCLDEDESADTERFLVRVRGWGFFLEKSSKIIKFSKKTFKKSNIQNSESILKLWKYTYFRNI